MNEVSPSFKSDIKLEMESVTEPSSITVLPKVLDVVTRSRRHRGVEAFATCTATVIC